jgi:hypothetical protein
MNDWLPESNYWQSEEEIPDYAAEREQSWFSQDIALGTAILTSDVAPKSTRWASDTH